MPDAKVIRLNSSDIITTSQDSTTYGGSTGENGVTEAGIGERHGWDEF